jgi:hypothetical protein
MCLPDARVWGCAPPKKNKIASQPTLLHLRSCPAPLPPTPHAGGADLVSAVQRCGGVRRVAEHLGLEYVETRGRKGRVGGGVGGGSAPVAEQSPIVGDEGTRAAYEDVTFV